jgi:hypothetical protein
MAGATAPATVLLLPERRRLGGEPPPGLARVLARAEASGTLAGEQAQLQRWFAPEGGQWPMAAIQRDAEAGDAGDATWLRADPVYLHAEMAGARLMAWDTLGLSADEADALLECVAPVFADEGVDIGRTAPERWYLRLPPGMAAPVGTVAPGDALGEDLFAHLPGGDDGRRWRCLQSEAQILLSQHPVNASRLARGAPTANSPWFWGAGVLPASVQARFAGPVVATRDPQLLALARRAQRECVAGDDGRAGLVDLRAARDWDAVARVLGGRIPGGLRDGLVLDFADAQSLRCRPPRWWQRWS